MYRILFVDNIAAAGFILKWHKFWDNSRFRITKFARNGEEALDILHKEQFDLVISDIQIPVINGLELVKRMRERGDQTCVILASTCRDFQYAKEGIRLGVLDYIVKPYTQKNMGEALSYAIPYLTRNKFAVQEDSNYKIWYKQKRKLLYEQLLEQEPGVVGFFSDIVKELAVYKFNEPKIVVESLLNDIWRRFQKQYPWITVKESLDIHISNEHMVQDSESVITGFQEIIRRYDLTHPTSVIPRTCCFMAEHLEEDNLIGKVSAEVELSRDYLGRIFKGQTGFLLSEFSTALKIRRAEQLLINSNLKIYQISDRLGYASVDYFSRLFREYIGCTPAAYRKNNGK